MKTQKVAGDEHVADKLTKNVKSDVLKRHMEEMGFIQATRREMDDDLTGAQEQINSLLVSAVKKNFAAQKAVGALCNKAVWAEAAAAAARRPFNITTRRHDELVKGQPTLLDILFFFTTQVVFFFTRVTFSVFVCSCVFF